MRPVGTWGREGEILIAGEASGCRFALPTYKRCDPQCGFSLPRLPLPDAIGGSRDPRAVQHGDRRSHQPTGRSGPWCGRGALHGAAADGVRDDRQRGQLRLHARSTRILRRQRDSAGRLHRDRGPNQRASQHGGAEPRVADDTLSPVHFTVSADRTGNDRGAGNTAQTNGAPLASVPVTLYEPAEGVPTSGDGYRGARSVCRPCRSVCTLA